MSTLPKPAPPPPLQGSFFRPRTRLGRATLWTAYVSLFFLVWGLVGRAWSGSSHLTGAILWGVIAAFFATLLGLRWARRGLLWKLRRRLIVTYIFIGVVPVLILLIIAGVGSYIFAGQFATYIVTSSLQSELQHLAAANDALAGQMQVLDRSGRLNRQFAAPFAAAASAKAFPQRSVTVWRGDKAFVLPAAGAAANAAPLQAPAGLTGNTATFFADTDGLYLRAIAHVGGGPVPLTVISSVPFTPKLLQSAASGLGAVTVFSARETFNEEDSHESTKTPVVTTSISEGRIPPSVDAFDWVVRFYTLFHNLDWQTGGLRGGAVGVVTRPSVLYGKLFGALGPNTEILRYVLLVLLGFFGVTELIALLIGLGLSRSITASVARLYTATEHINRGDLTQRIAVRGHDQMAALEQSFNSMTDSLVALLAEQQEKQRLESELVIAQEVQKQLFPQRSPDYEPLEVYGTCLAARSVSGDYYDFIPTGADGLLLAMGDVSGKGISAALLMATVHAFVRAYSLEQDEDSEAFIATQDFSRDFPQADAGLQTCSPATLMATLNYQLFRSTPTEKYVTMFLSCYSPKSRELTYCNAGHLPPILLSEDGGLTRLDPTATVVGIFGDSKYEQATVTMRPGDLFLVFSDGVTEPENSQGDFGDQRLIEVLRQHRDSPLSTVAQAVLNAVTAWIGAAEQPDDITVVLARAR